MADANRNHPMWPEYLAACLEHGLSQIESEARADRYTARHIELEVAKQMAIDEVNEASRRARRGRGFMLYR